jgi:hypothetical protein
VLDGGVLTSGIYGLQDNQHPPAAIGIEQILKLRKLINTAPQQICSRTLIAQFAMEAGIPLLQLETSIAGNAIEAGLLPLIRHCFASIAPQTTASQLPRFGQQLVRMVDM